MRKSLVIYLYRKSVKVVKMLQKNDIETVVASKLAFTGRVIGGGLF